MISVRIQAGGRWINVHNCYNPSGPIGDHTLGTLPLVERAIQEREGEDHVLVGDFNLHHPRWGGNNTQSQHWASDHLITITERAQMNLLLEPGTVTWENSRSCQTLDLVFGTLGIQQSI